jgi:riboflavin transporter FmnP
MKQKFDKATQILLPTFTVIGFLLTGLKKPQIGLIVSLISEIFWFYAAWQSWKKAKQIGILITTIIVTIVLLFGVINYWFFK